MSLANVFRLVCAVLLSTTAYDSSAGLCCSESDE